MAAVMSPHVPRKEVLFSGIFKELHRKLDREEKVDIKIRARRERSRTERAEKQATLSKAITIKSQEHAAPHRICNRRLTPICPRTSKSVEMKGISFFDLEEDSFSEEEDENNYNCYIQGSGLPKWLGQSGLRPGQKRRGLPLAKIRLSPKNRSTDFPDRRSIKKCAVSLSVKTPCGSTKSVPTSNAIEDESKPTQLTNLTLPSTELEEKYQSSDSIIKVIHSQVLFNEQLKHRDKQLVLCRKLSTELVSPTKPTDIVSQFEKRFSTFMAQFTQRLDLKAKTQLEIIQEDRQKIEKAIHDEFQEQDNQVLEWEKHWKMNRRFIQCGLEYPHKKMSSSSVNNNKFRTGSGLLPSSSEPERKPVLSKVTSQSNKLSQPVYPPSQSQFLHAESIPEPVTTKVEASTEFHTSATKTSDPELSLPTTFAFSEPTATPFPTSEVVEVSNGFTSMKASSDVLQSKSIEQLQDPQKWNWKNRAEKIKEIHDNAECILENAKADNPRGMKNVHMKVRKIFAQLSAIQSVVVEKNRALNQLGKDHSDLKEVLLCLIAKELISKADTAVRKNQEIVFAFAYVAFMQARANKKFVKVFLGFLATKCSFVIPSLLMRKDFKTEDEWYSALCLLEKPDIPMESAVENNLTCGETKVFEPVVSWLNRVRSCMLLYGAFIQINHFQGSHPRDIFYAWRWLARVLNSPPNLGTATALHSFLKVVAYQMMQSYPVQFKKLLAFVKKDYLNRLPQDTNEMQFGLHKLENLLEEYNETGIKKPQGAVFGNLVITGSVD